jgi:hypothetical protein
VVVGQVLFVMLIDTLKIGRPIDEEQGGSKIHLMNAQTLGEISGNKRVGPTKDQTLAHPFSSRTGLEPESNRKHYLKELQYNPPNNTKKYIDLHLKLYLTILMLQKPNTLLV